MSQPMCRLCQKHCLGNLLTGSTFGLGATPEARHLLSRNGILLHHVVRAAPVLWGHLGGRHIEWGRHSSRHSSSSSSLMTRHALRIMQDAIIPAPLSIALDSRAPRLLARLNIGLPSPGIAGVTFASSCLVSASDAPRSRFPFQVDFVT